MKPLGAVPIFLVERERHERAKGLLLVGARGLHGQALLEPGAGGPEIAAVLQQPREREDCVGVVRLECDGLFVGAYGLVGAPIEPVKTRKGYRRRVLLGPWLLRAAFEVCHELGDAPVSLSVKLRQALQRKGGARLSQHHLRVPLDEGSARGTAGRRARALRRRVWPVAGGGRRRSGPAATVGVKVLRGDERRKQKSRRESGQEATDPHKVSLDANRPRRTSPVWRPPHAKTSADPRHEGGQQNESEHGHE